ncbi:MAG: hypothetical protein OES09_04920 [Gammaproteobacteria bacterium]|nr:hypothetical protein [Gammaproteobacteria bacterium]
MTEDTAGRRAGTEGIALLSEAQFRAHLDPPLPGQAEAIKRVAILVGAKNTSIAAQPATY